MNAAERPEKQRRHEHDDAVNAPVMQTDQDDSFYGPERRAHSSVPGSAIQYEQAWRLRRAEDRLYRRELEFKTLVENSPDVISRIDTGLRHLYVNPAAERSFGIDAPSFIGKTICEAGLPKEMDEAWKTAAQQAFAQRCEQQFSYEVEVGGEDRSFTTRLIPERDRSGNVLSLLAVTYDTTARTRMEKERDDLLLRERAARIQAETAARARDEFLAIVSHELRAPLNGIQSWTHVLDNYTADVTPLGKRAIEGIKTGVAQQVRLIEDLLDATGMMSGKLRLTRRPMAALPAIQAAVESVKPMADEKSLALDYDYRISREQIEGDPDRIQQIVWNLLTNAVKFTAEGGRIMLTASREDSCLRIDVRDTGIGIAPAFMPRLFDRFSQQDSSSTRHASGLGLGLFVVRHLVELHGGSISVESKGKGHGSQFTVLIPLRARGSCRQAAHCHDACSLPSLQGLDILLIDDDAEARESLGALMSSQGARVTTAASGADAIACLDGSASALPHLVICDIAMPGEDGYAVLRRLRNWRDTSGDRPLRHTPALALTAFSQREDRLRALSAGFQMHAAKPVAADELAIMIMNMTRRDL